MILGRVAGTVVSTVHHQVVDGKTLLLVDLVDPSGAPLGSSTIAIDTVGAGAGELVLLIDEGGSARQILADPAAPIRTVVAGIVDRVDLG